MSKELTARPRIFERRVISDRANKLGRYLSDRAALSTFLRVSAETLAPSVKVRDTAERETPAIRATSCEVAGRRRNFFFGLLKRIS